MREQDYDFGVARGRPLVSAPTRREIAQSTGLTAAVAVAVGLVATLGIGAVLVFFDIANTDPTADYQTQTGLPMVVFQVALVAVLVVVWAVACRLGSGAPGDAIMGLEARRADGGPASRGAIMARAALPVVLFGVLALLERPGLGFLALLLLWLPALVRADRRTAVDLAVGITPHSHATRRDARPHPWTR